MAITVAEVTKIYTIITGESERIFNNVFTPAQATNIAAEISKVVTVDDIFTDATAEAYAATKTPAEVFTGEAGIAKLAAWATSAGYTKA